MLSDKKILITGVTGSVAWPIARFLAERNQVFGAARFQSDESREKVISANIEPCPMDLEKADVSQLPRDVDYVLHFAFMRGTLDDFDRAMTVNGEGTGLVLQHCATILRTLGSHQPRHENRRGSRGQVFRPCILPAGHHCPPQHGVWQPGKPDLHAYPPDAGG